MEPFPRYALASSPPEQSPQHPRPGEITRPANALLVYPACPKTFWSFAHALRIAGKKALLPPLGLLTVAAMLPDTWNKRLVDLNVAPELTDQDLDWAQYVFIGGMSLQRHAAREIIARAKAAGKIVIAGGPLFTMEYALFQDVDHFVLNEAELTLPSLLADLERGCARRVYRSRQFADMTQTPAPLWELADLSQYALMGVQYSRGCPFGCEFCNVTTILGRQSRHKTSRQVIDELDSLDRAGWRGPVFFVDDNLIGSRKAVKEDLLPALIERRKTHAANCFITQVSIDLADDAELLSKMVRAGFSDAFIGIETPMPAGLSECGKTQNEDRDLVADVRKIQHAGIEVQAGFILGFDSDTPATFDTMVQFIQASGIVSAMVGMLQAAPGTRLYARLRQEGRLLGNSSGDNADGSTNIMPRMGLQVLHDGYEDVLRRIYAAHPYYQRVRTLLMHLRQQPRHSVTVLRGLPSFARALYALGVRDQDRLEFWRLLHWAAPRGLRTFSAAVRLAIYGYHYRRSFRERVLHPASLVTSPALEASENGPLLILAGSRKPQNRGHC